MTIDKNKFYGANGKRKTATCRIRIYPGSAEITIKDVNLNKGDIYVNELPVSQYFPGEMAKTHYLEPFRTTNTLNRFIITALCSGGGNSSQLDAFIHASSRALSKVDPEKFHAILAKRGFLTRDDRKKERKKPGLMGARKKKQSPKR